MKIEKKYFPYEEGKYKIDFHGAYKVTPEMHDTESICKSVLWPLMITIMLALLPILLIRIIYDKL